MVDASDLLQPDDAKQPIESMMFVSHTADDEPLLRAELQPIARRPGLQLHILNRGTPAPFSEAYRKQILRTLAASAWFFAALTSRSVHSAWVKFEVGWALDHKPKSRLILAVLEDCDP